MSIALDRADLSKLERTIERGMSTFVEVGRALAEIKKRLLYKQEFSTFEEYCRERWGWTRHRANYLVSAANLPDDLVTRVTTERHARPLRKLASADEQRSAWDDAVATAPGGKVTARHVERVVRERLEPTRVAGQTISEESSIVNEALSLIARATTLLARCKNQYGFGDSSRERIVSAIRGVEDLCR